MSLGSTTSGCAKMEFGKKIKKLNRFQQNVEIYIKVTNKLQYTTIYYITIFYKVLLKCIENSYNIYVNFC